jgi:acylphosphatase
MWFFKKKKEKEPPVSTEGMIRMHVIFYGRVQGVDFRFHATSAAQDLGLTGWVKNCEDGSVEMEVQGKEDLIYTMIRNLSKAQSIEIQDYKSEVIPVKKNEKGFKPSYSYF